MLYTAELTKSSGGAPVESLDAMFIKAADLEEAKRAALKWAEEKAISGIDGTLALQLVRRGRGVFTHIYREQVANGS
jgi:hypothetical protein